MSEIKNNDKVTESKMISEIWRVIKKYYLPEEQDGYWADLVTDLDEIYKRYPTELCKYLCLTTASCKPTSPP